jgi:hypothetical protein
MTATCRGSGRGNVEEDGVAMSELPFNDSRYSEGIDFGLLQREDVVPVQIRYGPYDDNYQERNEACTIVYHLRKGKYYGYPINDIVCHKDQVEWVSKPQFDWSGVSRVFPLPSEPPGRMVFNNRSVDGPKNRHPDEARKVRQDRSG